MDIVAGLVATAPSPAVARLDTRRGLQRVDPRGDEMQGPRNSSASRGYFTGMSSSSISTRRSLLASALLVACGPDRATETAGTDSEGTSGGASSTTGDDPTGGPPPAGCGEGEVEWIYTEAGSKDLGARALDVMVDGTGRIIVAAVESGDDGLEQPLLLVLDPAGVEVWRTPLTGPLPPEFPHDVVTDDAGRIFVAGRAMDGQGAPAGFIRAYAGDGSELWGFDAPGHDPGLDAAITGLAPGHGALYSVGAETDTLVLRRHDLATGEAVWKTHYSEGLQLIERASVAVVGDVVLAVAKAAFGDGSGHPFVLQLGGDGAIQSVTVEESIAGWWLGVGAIGGAGDRLLAGEQYTALAEGVAVRRAGSDGAEVWSTLFDPAPQTEELWDAAVAPDERILMVGTTRSDDGQKTIPSARCLAGDGSGHLQLPFAFDAEEYEDEPAYGGAFGPGFMVLVGSRTEDRDILWVRKYAAE